MNILNFLKNILGKSAGSEEIKPSSEVGSKDLTGIGGNNGSNNTWLVILLVAMLCTSCFFLGRCSHVPEVIQVPQVVVQPGIPDTTHGTATPISGVSNPSHTHTVYPESPDTVGILLPDFVDAVIADTSEKGTVNIRATAYPYLERDSIKINQVIEYNIQIKPIEIVRVDTLSKPYPVPAEIPWIEHPATVATGVSVAWLAILIILL